MKKVLIAGAGSYIGDAAETWLTKTGKYKVNIVDMRGIDPKNIDFSDIDVVFHVAGIAHIKETNENAHLYYEVNRDLAIETAKAAKDAGVGQFILLSTMSVYGMITGKITKVSVPNPKNHYGKSKLEADEEIVKIADNSFKVCILRPPMVYGKGCKGNYQLLRKLALNSPIFPSVQNQRSMIYIENLCDFVEKLIRDEKSGLFFPQNKEYVCTSEMVRCIAKEHKHKICFIGIANPLLKHCTVAIVEKVFGSLIYDCSDDRCDAVGTFEETIRKSET